jgi:N-acetylglucosaminyl-diphospho-decaprenol L-rhamnosyltransferase
MKLSIIIVNYNTGLLTSSCLKKILSQNLPFAFEIIVIDNASSDDSVSFLRSDFPDIDIISNDKNLGLASGVNIGLKKAIGEYKLILNPDIIVLDKAIQTLVEYMDKNTEVGMTGGKLLSPNGKLQYSCYRFYKPTTILYRRTWLGNTKKGKSAVNHFLMKDYDHKNATEVDWLMGACLMVRSKALDDVDGMDDHFFLYFEDVDWCRRFWEANWSVVYVPTAKFSHYHQRSSEGGGFWGIISNWVVREHVKSAIKYFWKYRGKPWPRSKK